jgi:hypothetical protein
MEEIKIDTTGSKVEIIDEIFTITLDKCVTKNALKEVYTYIYTDKIK